MADENQEQDRKSQKEQYETQRITSSRLLKSNSKIRESIVFQ